MWVWKRHVRYSCDITHGPRSVSRYTNWLSDACSVMRVKNTGKPSRRSTSSYPNSRERSHRHGLLEPLPTARLGLNLILVMMDIYTRYTKLYPLRKAGTAGAIKAVETFIQVFGPMQSIVSDNASCFRSALWEKHWEMQKVAECHVAPYNPSGSPAERVLRVLGDRFRVHQQDRRQSCWIDIVKDVEASINEMEHRTT